MNKELFHYGTPHVGLQSHSGRYEWDPSKHRSDSYISNMSFIEKDVMLRKQGLSEKERVEALGLSTVTEYRKLRSVARAEQQAALISRAQRLRDHGYGATEIGKKMGGVSESTVRGWLEPRETTRKQRINGVADQLEEKLKRGEIIDVGLGTELDLGVTSDTLKTALKVLQDKGYVLDQIDVQQPNNPTKATTVKYIAPPGTTKKEVWDARGNISTVREYSTDGGITFQELQHPSSISSDRVKIIYTDDEGHGGVERDGMIGIRRNVADLSLGNSLYAQVRIAVDDKYYIKGMAIYDDNIPKGYDICVYSNKKESAGMEGALKKLKDDPNNIFGADIKRGGQSFYSDKDGKFVKQGDIFVLDEKGKVEGERYSLSPINKLKEEGEWGNGSKNLSAQFLSKQPMQLINRQLDLTYKDAFAEYDEIMSLSNPVVKKKLLNDFAEGADKSAVDLKASALPRQSTKVIIPVPELGDNEVYAPTYKNGENVVLIRYPHAGTFEIPYLKVNNNNPTAKKLLGNATDAIGINNTVAAKLSGADFDGDFVVTIPVNDKVKVKWDKSLAGLKGFDPSSAYPGYPGMKVMTDKEKGKQMGIVSNLITDMTLLDADPDEMVRAVKHSMVVIDAQKHELNYKLSEKENGIEALKQKYQKNPNKAKGYGGTTTLVSKSKSEITIPEREVVNAEGKKSYTADPETGEWLYKDTGREYAKLVKKNGKPVLDENGNKVYEKSLATQKITQMAYAKDARDLISTYNTPQEKAYANYANKMKALANTARKEALALETPKADPEATKTYAKEVASLTAKLNVAKKNKPRERQAQLKTSVRVEQLLEQDPTLKDRKDKLRKEKSKILTQTRLEVGAGKQSVEITDREWEAIQARAISGTKLKEILDNADMEKVRKLATPKLTTTLPSAKVSRIKALSTSGNSIAEIAEIMGISTATVSKYLKS